MKNENELTPLVTVIIPCFNVASYLGETLLSIQAQSMEDFEVIAVDDFSTDETRSIIRDFAARDDRFRYIQLHANSGVAIARNRGLEVARGAYIAMLDGDDLWPVDALAHRTDLAKRYSDVDVIVTDFAWFEHQVPAKPQGRVGMGPRASSQFSESFSTGKATLVKSAMDFALHHYAWVGATLIKRSAMAAINNFEPAFDGPEDTLLWLRLANNHTFLFSPPVTAYYRQRPGSIVSGWRLDGPIDEEHIKALQWTKANPDFVGHLSAIKVRLAECHHVCALYHRKARENSTGLWHAFRSIQNDPHRWVYWRELSAALFHTVFR